MHSFVVDLFRIVVFDLCAPSAVVEIGLEASVVRFDESFSMLRALSECFLLSNAFKGTVLLIL